MQRSIVALLKGTIIVHSVVLLFSQAVVAQVPAVEREALLALFTSTGGETWNTNTGWCGPPGTECSWYGVTCSGEHVQQISMSLNGLDGPLPPEIGNLSELEVLDLGYNPLNGPLPPEIGGLRSIVELRLSPCELSGTLPSELGDLDTMEVLDLRFSSLGGALPTKLGQARNLRELYLSSNELTGEIPSSFGSLQSLEKLELAQNQLTGEIQTQLGKITTLQKIVLHTNRLQGNIPVEICNLPNLNWLEVASNRLQGDIPEEITNLSDVVYLNIAYNALWASHASVQTFLDTNAPDWEATQTVAPTHVTTDDETSCAVTVSWTPIQYTSDNGGYRVWWATTSGGPYYLYPVATATKDEYQLTVTGLDPLQTYWFAVETWTEPHNWNQNTVTSTLSMEISESTTSGPPELNDDVNGDDLVTAADLEALGGYFFGGPVLVADVDCDGSADAGDLTVLIECLEP